MRRLLSICLTTIGAFAVVFAIGAFLILHAPSDPIAGSSASTSSHSASDRGASDQPLPDQPVQPSFSVKNGNTTYYGTMASDVGVAVLGLHDAGGYLSGGFEELAKADGKFIVVAVAVNNRQNTAITMDTNLFEILDSSGNVYSASEKSMEVGTGNDLFLARINPGITKTGLVVFDVPPTLSLDNLRLSFRGGMTGDTAVLPLQVNSTVQQVAAPPSPVPEPSGESQPSIENTAAQQQVRSDTIQSVSPNTISIGQTPAEVTAILGSPISATTGAQHVYTYPHLTIVFVDGKVSEIHRDQAAQ